MTVHETLVFCCRFNLLFYAVSYGVVSPAAIASKCYL